MSCTCDKDPTITCIVHPHDNCNAQPKFGGDQYGWYKDCQCKELQAELKQQKEINEILREAIRKAERDKVRGLFSALEQMKGGVYLTINEERAYYEEVPKGKRYALQWFPDTPIGSYTVYSDTFDGVVQAALDAIKEVE